MLVDLADKTSNYNCFTMYWKLIEDKDSNSELDEAVNLLLECLPDCPEAYDQALDFLQQMIDSTSKLREKLTYVERALSIFERPNCKVDIERAAQFIAIAKAINPKSQSAHKVEMALYRTDMVALGRLRSRVTDAVLQEIDRDISPVRFAQYPHDERWTLELRRRINREIEKRI